MCRTLNRVRVSAPESLLPAANRLKLIDPYEYMACAALFTRTTREVV